MGMYVNLPMAAFSLIHETAQAINLGRKGPMGWGVKEVRDELERCSGEYGGNYNRIRHEMGEEVALKVVEP